MLKFFILSIKQKLKTYILLKIFSKITTLLKVINFYKIIILEISFLNALIIFFYSSFLIKSTYTENIYFKAAYISNISAIKD